MKRLCCLLLVLALCLGLGGCGSHPATSQATDSGAAPQPPDTGATSQSTQAEPDPAPEPEPEPEPEPQPEPEPEPVEPYDVTLCFAGDVSLADGSVPAQALASRGLEGCFDQTLLDAMAQADLMCLNSEFAFTTRGEQQDKNYTFRADPDLISVYQELGVDLAVLANNHVFDYGETGLQDTLDTFRSAGLPYVGAGENIDEASAIFYAELDGCTVASIAGCRGEWAAATRGATERQSGVFRTAESNALICQRIAEARENADFVVVYEHWGMEGDTVLEEYQTDSGREFIDAGADVVVGDHPHVVQGIEWYNGKPIFYSMGNYWFSSMGRYTMLLQVELQKDDTGATSTGFRLVPGWTQGGKVSALTDPDSQREFYDYLEGISINAAISDDGLVTETA